METLPATSLTITICACKRNEAHDPAALSDLAVAWPFAYSSWVRHTITHHQLTFSDVAQNGCAQSTTHAQARSHGLQICMPQPAVAGSYTCTVNTVSVSTQKHIAWALRKI